MLHLFGLITFEMTAADLTFGFQRAGFSYTAPNTGQRHVACKRPPRLCKGKRWSRTD